MADKTYPDSLNGVHFSMGNSGGPIPEAAWCRFYDRMKDNVYDYDSTYTAWLWFYAGWDSHIIGPRNDRITNQEKGK